MITLYHCADARPFPALGCSKRSASPTNEAAAFQRVKQAQAGGPGSALAVELDMRPEIGLSHWFAQRASAHAGAQGAIFRRAILDLRRDAARHRGSARLGFKRWESDKGDRVAFLGLNQPMFFFAMFATSRGSAAIFVPLNFRLTGPELAFMINDCGAAALIVDAHLAPTIAPIREQLTTLKAFLPAEKRGQLGQAAN